MKFEEKRVYADLVVVGAGAAGMCAAIQAAREGTNVVLINDRGVVGGNCSTEVNITMGGAPDCAPLNINSREGGIVEEIRIETAYRTPELNRYIKDMVFMDYLNAEKERLHLYLNTCVDAAEVDGQGRIVSVSGTQNTTETRFTFIAPLFVDDTGDGALGALAGADYMLGRESKDTFGERIAPDEADSFVIPSTLTFYAKDTGKPVRFIAPDNAVDIAKSGALQYRKIPHNEFSFKWYYEGDGAKDQVKDREEIIADHRALVYGIWDYIKNSGEYPEAENYDLEFVGLIPGVREYRRLCGDKILTESDLSQQHEYEDAVGHGGWNIDLHAIHGFFDPDLINRHIGLRGPYQIPYRCGYSRNVSNLFMCGRCMSASHVAFGSTRVVAALSTLGQAVGMAAAMCKEYATTPRGIYENHMQEMQQRLLREDQLILGLKNQDPRDKALCAHVSASSEAALRLSPAQDTMEMGEGFALVLPLVYSAKRLLLFCASDVDTTLNCKIYKPFKGYNFGPDELVQTVEIAVPASAAPQEIALPVEGLTPGSYYFYDFAPNPHLRFAFAPEALLTTIQHKRYRNQAENVWDYSAMDMSEYAYARDYTHCVCYRFDPEQRPYAAAQVNNGYNRAYFNPNLRLSAPEDQTPTLTLSWNKPVELSGAQVTFAVDTTLKIYYYDKRMLKNISTDYKLFGALEGKERLLCQVHGNHMKRNRLHFEKGTFDTLKFVFEKNHGGQVAVQEVRAE